MILCNYDINGRIGVSTELFLNKYLATIATDENERLCIRMASSMFIGTGYKHLQVFEDYKDEQLEKMDMIE